MRKTLSRLLPALLVPALLLTGCSADDEAKEAAEGLGLEAGDGGATEATPTPTEAPPAPPIDSLTEDLSTPEGAAQAYMNYLQLGKGSDTCRLFTPEAIATYFNTEAECAARVEEYAESVLYTFQNSLNVAEGLTVRVNSKTADQADVGISVKVNEAEATSYYDRLLLSRAGEEWRITSSAVVAPSEQTED